MKKVKKLLCLLLSLAMALCLAVPAFAVGDTYTLTINSETPNHDYEVYQIFSGTLTENESGEKILSHMDWGSGVKPINISFATQLEVAYILAGLEYPFKDLDWGVNQQEGSFEDCIEALQGLQDNSQALDIFASVINDYLADTPTATGSAVRSGNKYVATIGNLEPGYYLIKEAAFTGTEGDNNAYTKFMLQVVGDTEVNAKADVPTITKKIKDGQNLVDAVEASIGDTVIYELNSTVPVMDGYNEYYFIVTDTLSEGLTLNQTQITVEIGDQTLTQGTDYTFEVTPNTAGVENQLKIVFKDFIENTPGDAIKITYPVVINKHAEVGTTGNPNAVTLEYSNDPNFDYKGVDEPLPDEPTGETPEDITVVYVAGVQLNKVNSKGMPLTGAKFQISGTGIVNPGITRYTTFNQDDRWGYYYKLLNGTYTTAAPTADTEKYYVNDGHMYIHDLGTTIWGVVSTNKSKEGEVGYDGVIKFTGLGAGSYTIEETVVPAGYNKIDNITLTLNCQVPSEITDGTEKCAWSGSYQIGNEAPVTIEAATVGDSGIITFDVVNHTGAELPSTGGMGTTLFLYGGAGLMVLALAALALSKKKNRDGE